MRTGDPSGRQLLAADFGDKMSDDFISSLRDKARKVCGGQRGLQGSNDWGGAGGHEAAALGAKAFASAWNRSRARPTSAFEARTLAICEPAARGVRFNPFADQTASTVQMCHPQFQARTRPRRRVRPSRFHGCLGPSAARRSSASRSRSEACRPAPRGLLTPSGRTCRASPPGARKRATPAVMRAGSRA
jgi:hypothetical protein